MGRRDWFRNETWTAADKSQFFERLARSRTTFHKAQYLRIQAVHLERTGDKELVHEALGLLDLILSQYPEPFELATVHWQRATCLQFLGRVDESMTAYRDALTQQRSGRGAVPGGASLDYAHLIFKLGRSDLFDEALSVLDGSGGDELLPLDRYRSGMIRAFIYEFRGDLSKAALFARAALSASSETESVFRYHRDLGVVREIDPEVQRRLWELAR
jgi:tetratricopeptide (TPR) repeat protein